MDEDRVACFDSILWLAVLHKHHSLLDQCIAFFFFFVWGKIMCPRNRTALVPGDPATLWLLSQESFQLLVRSDGTSEKLFQRTDKHGSVTPSDRESQDNSSFLIEYK